MPKKSLLRTSSSGRVQYSKVLVKTADPLEIERNKTEYQTEDHIIDLRDLMLKLRTNAETGLSVNEADARLAKFGPNCLVASASKNIWIVLFENFFSGFSSLLWIGSISSFVGYFFAQNLEPATANEQLYMGVVLLIVVMFTGIFGFIQEKNSIKVMEGFSKVTPKTAVVIRDEKEMTIPVDEIVVGDVVLFKAGEVVPADVRIVKSHDLAIECSALTGESKPINKSPDFTDLNPMETENLAFFGSYVMTGHGRGIVIATSNNTAMGRIATLTTGIERQETSLKKDLKKFLYVISTLALFIGLTFFIISIALGYSFFVAILYFIAISVANIPESLLVTMTACLTLTAERMKEKNCAVKNLQAIETLGSISVICSDKTGTLTQNKMMVSHMFYDGIIHDVLTRQDTLNKKSEGLAALCKIAVLCSNATFLPGQENVPIDNRIVSGDATESAVLKFFEKITLGRTQNIRNDKPKIFEIPFNSTLKYQVSIHEIRDNGLLLVLKGAPERILNFCSTYYDGTETVPLGEQIKKSIYWTVQGLGELAERVLGFCDTILPSDKYSKDFAFTKKNVPIINLRFVGLVSLVDPPRASVPDAVARCRSAGIRVIMVTGDHPITAAAMARKVGIFSDTIAISLENDDKENTMEAMGEETKSITVTGQELRQLSNEDLVQLVVKYQEIVFARTSPQQKLKIVEAFQTNGYIVASTGDGVNDAPALKKANIGIAMGITGTDIAKEAADMILLDDNFASIVTGIEEGRLIFENLKKSIAFLLTSNVPECVPFVLFVCYEMPMALSVISIIAIDVGTDLWPSITLAYEKSEADIMVRAPRNVKKDKLVTTKMIVYAYFQIGLIQTFAALTSFFFLMAAHGWFLEDLIGVREKWEDRSMNNLEDSYGIEWTYEERMILQRKGFSATFFAIVITQIADLIACKTRRLSIFQQGMWNWCMNFSIIFEIFFACIVVYAPVVQGFLLFHNIEWIFVIPAIPYSFLIVLYDEVRKLLIRRKPGGWFEKELYY